MTERADPAEACRQALAALMRDHDFRPDLAGRAEVALTEMLCEYDQREARR